MQNRFRLDRGIPTAVKRLVRQNSKFSCVICRAPFCTYEHFDPEFKDATEHVPEGICLLCANCQLDTTAGRLSKEAIRRCYEARRAETRVESRKDNAFIFDRMPTVKLGESIIRQADTIICTDQIDCLSFERDEESGMFQINMRIFDHKGERMLEIANNTWVSEYAPWDFEVIGKTITFRSGPGQILFRAKLDAEDNTVEITHLDMAFENSRVRLENGRIVVSRISIDGSRQVWLAIVFEMLGCKAAVFMDNRVDVPKFHGGIPLLNNPFCGITFGRLGNGYIKIFSMGGKGIRPSTPRKEIHNPRPREAYVKGQLLIRTIDFPFWSEHEFYLNGVLLSDRPFSVDDYGECELGGSIELFHLGSNDAFKFRAKNGLIANSEAELIQPPARPHQFG
jgi:hypothetical protein